MTPPQEQALRRWPDEWDAASPSPAEDFARKVADALVERFRADIEAQMRQVAADLFQQALSERDAAVRDAWNEGRRDGAAQLSQQLAETTLHVRVDERQAVLAGLDHLLSAVRRLDEARSLTHVLDVFAESTSAEVARVAILLVQGSALRAWRLSGFASNPDHLDRLEIDANETGLLGHVIKCGQTCFVQGSDHASGDRTEGLSFAPLPPDRVGLAVPVIVGGQVVAIAYADDVADGARPVPAAWPEVIEILARHAARTLEALTAAKVVEAVALANRAP